MIKLKEILEDLDIVEPTPEAPSVIDLNNVPEAESNKTINDEFKVNEYMLAEVKKMLDKVNKKLKARNLPELELEILDDRVEEFSKKTPKGEKYKRAIRVYTIKINGNIPEINDYEFVAKIQHTPQGNIINMSPKSTVEKLPDEYKTHSQRCDICKTDRERNDTFIIKKVDTGELLCAGRNCLGKFMPLDTVKAFVEYSVRLQDLRNLLANYENNLFDTDDDYYGYGGGRGGRVEYLEKQEDVLFFCAVIYFQDNQHYVSKTVAQNSDIQSTISKAMSLKSDYENMNPKYADLRRDAIKTVNLYKADADKFATDVLTWAQSYDFAKAAQENPKMDAYFNNLQVLLKQPYIQPRNFGYFASLISLYLRELDKGRKRVETGAVEYFGNVGEKFANITVELVFSTFFDSQYGTVWIQTMRDENNHMFVYKGKYLGFNKGDWFKLSGTIKSHQEYKGVKQTIIQRPKTTKIGEK